VPESQPASIIGFFSPETKSAIQIVGSKQNAHIQIPTIKRL
jgi:hypothetical protein